MKQEKKKLKFRSKKFISRATVVARVKKNLASFKCVVETERLIDHNGPEESP